MWSGERSEDEFMTSLIVPQEISHFFSVKTILALKAPLCFIFYKNRNDTVQAPSGEHDRISCNKQEKKQTKRKKWQSNKSFENKHHF